MLRIQKEKGNFALTEPLGCAWRTSRFLNPRPGLLVPSHLYRDRDWGQIGAELNTKKDPGQLQPWLLGLL